ncbi:MAG TPA: flagellar basal body P-ring protein FlgI [Chthonomonadaceae bacterium]|nr:flagellar basal body P-ring protein FlgI [Chthonomonadaceae bacterium]
MKPLRFVITTAILLAMAAAYGRAETPLAAGDVPLAGVEGLAAPPAKARQTSARPNTRVAARQREASSYAPGLVRIKDIADVQGVRGNQLIGYGLVTGLEGTGDGQSSLFTIQTISNMLRKFGITVSPDAVRVKNVAAVMVTADLPAFVKPGSKIDVTVSSLGDAKSLQGGTLLQTPLRAANGEIYAVAQGPLSIGGFNFGAGGSSVQKNHVNVGRIPHGAYVEQEVPTTLSDGNTIQITLRDPDFTTASRIASAIRRQLPGVGALASDAATVAVSVPAQQADDLIGFIAVVENVSVTPDVQARIVVNERTGTVVMGGNVRLAPGAIAHGAINIRIENTPVVVPAPPFSRNTQPLVVPFKSTQVQEKPSQLAPVPATTTVDQLVRALNTLGVTPRDLISILQGMHSAGMIAAEIEVQ